jgi:hypothetical protein
MKFERRHDIDWLRVIAIGLLLIYHIAIVFQPWAMSVAFIRNQESMVGLWKPMTLLNVWRIPLLFYVSGMGVYFAICRRNWKQLLLERSARILLPFLFGIIAITPLHMFFFQKYYNLPLGYYPHQGHLWFLGNIFAYVLLLSPLFFYLKKKANGRFQVGLSAIMSHPVGPLSISLFFVIEVLLLKPMVFAMYAQTWHGFFLGFIAFLFGFLFVYSGKTFWQTMLKWKWLYLGLAVAFYTIRLTVFKLNAPDYLLVIESNCWIFALFGFAYKYLNRSSKILSYLSQSVYPIYIIHMVFLYLASWLILPLDISAGLKFMLVTASTFLGCFLTYEFVLRRIGFLKPLIGLKWKLKEVKK